ncbi:MAG: hypothetical protein BRC25_00100 [Parcubacteria group bacterium SW_6_46_9]|nr:MAG: hypothetical protein BRC25_00100 [Parcubacteria group bacterium SW_6_46_9]
MRDEFLVYIGCGLTDAPQEFIGQVGELKKTLDQVSHVRVLDFVGKGDTNSVEVRKRDLSQVASCDLMVAICEFGSTGLGMEMQKAVAENKHILACASTLDRSQLVRGIESDRFSFFQYEQMQNVVEQVEEWVEWQGRPEYDKENESYFRYLYRLAIANPKVYQKKRERIENMQDGPARYRALKHLSAVEEMLT